MTLCRGSRETHLRSDEFGRHDYREDHISADDILVGVNDLRDLPVAACGVLELGGGHLTNFEGSFLLDSELEQGWQEPRRGAALSEGNM